VLEALKKKLCEKCLFFKSILLEWMKKFTRESSNMSIRPLTKNFAEELSFQPLKSSSPFKSIVEKALGALTFSKVMDKKKQLECQVLQAKNSQLVGLIVYKKDLKNYRDLPSCFVLKAFLSLDRQATSKEALLNRVTDLAHESSAEGVLLKILETSESIGFLITKNFRIMKVLSGSKESNDRKYLLHLPLSSKITNSLESNPRDLKVTEEPSRKRLLNAEETQPSKKEKREETTMRKEKPLENVKEKKTRASSKSEENELRSRTSKEHWLPMKGTEYFDYIMNGKKLFEGRINGPACHSMHVGDTLKLFDRRAKWGIICQIISKDVYPSFDAMLRDKGVLAMLPQLESTSRRVSEQGLIAEGVKIYKQFPGSSRVTQNGAVAIGVKFIKKVYE
jgi:ASC-1-like (ASCH) protein